MDAFASEVGSNVETGGASSGLESGGAPRRTDINATALKSLQKEGIASDLV